MTRQFAGERDHPTPAAQLLHVGVVCVPIDGETVCGDGWTIVQDGQRAVVLLVDGLGHGSHAAEAADVASAAFRAASDRSPREIAGVVHDALRGTRGAAIAIAEVRRLSHDDGVVVYFCGIGNTVSALIGASGTKALPSMNGTAGLQARLIQQTTQPWIAGGVLVMHTDGLTTRWRMERHPGLLAHDPSVVAAVLHRDHSRGRDDATVLVLALSPSPR